MAQGERSRQLIQARFDENVKKKALLKEVTAKINTELNKLMIEEMNLVTLIRMEQEKKSSASASVVPSTSGTSTDQPPPSENVDEEHLDEELNLQILNYGNLSNPNFKMQTGNKSGSEEEEDDEEDDVASVELYVEDSSDTDTTCETFETNLQQ